MLFLAQACQSDWVIICKRAVSNLRHIYQLVKSLKILTLKTATHLLAASSN